MVQSINCWFRLLILVLSGMGWLGAKFPLFACSVGLWGTLTVRSLRLCKLAERKGEARGCELLDWRGPQTLLFSSHLWDGDRILLQVVLCGCFALLFVPSSIWRGGALSVVWVLAGSAVATW